MCYKCQKIYHRKCLEEFDKVKKQQKLKFHCPNYRDELPLKKRKEKVNYKDYRKKEGEFMNKINEYENKNNLIKLMKVQTILIS